LFSIAEAFLGLLGRFIRGVMDRAGTLEAGLRDLSLQKHTRSFGYAVDAVRWLLPAFERSSDLGKGQGVWHIVRLLVGCRERHGMEVRWFDRGQGHLVLMARRSRKQGRRWLQGSGRWVRVQDRVRNRSGRICGGFIEVGEIFE